MFGSECIEFRLFGTEELERLFAELPRAVQTRVIKPAMQEAARTLTQAARAEAPDDTGFLKAALGRSTTRKYAGTFFVTVGVRRTYKPDATGHPMYYLGAVTKGRAESIVGMSKGNPTDAKVLSMMLRGGKLVFGRRAKPTQANPFISHAFESAQGQVLAQLQTSITAGTLAEADKLGK